MTTKRFLEDGSQNSTNGIYERIIIGNRDIVYSEYQCEKKNEGKTDLRNIQDSRNQYFRGDIGLCY